MLGVALGDLHGSVWEGGRAPSRVPGPLTDRHRVTDDTVLSMAVVEHLLDHKPPASSLQQWARWYPGAGYSQLFRRWALDGGERPDSWGNGALMRILPVAVLADSLESAIETALAFNRSTHAHEVALSSTRDYITLAWMALEGAPKADLLAQWTAWGRPLHDVERHRQTRCSMRLRADVPREDVVSCLPETDDYASLLGTCTYHGGDSDTIAAIAGGLGELLWGVPPGMAQALSGYLDGRIDRQMRRLYDAAALRRPERWGPRGSQTRWPAVQDGESA
jgi:ADP-ribosylglycohydrolase